MPAPIADRLDALHRIIMLHTSWNWAISCILDYLDDPAAISSPSLIADLDIVIGGDPEFSDITQAHELIEEIAPQFARCFAARAELCHDHSSDPDNCADEH